MILNFIYEILITRLKNMVSSFRTDFLQAGLFGVALVFALSLIACDKDDPSKKNANKDLPLKHEFSAVVLDVTGDARIKVDGEASNLSLGQNIYEKTQLTSGVASSVVLSVADGSALKIDGKSDVQFDVAIESLKRSLSVSLLHGRLLFDVQKQAVKDEFVFRTEKVSAIARGAAGFIEYTDGLNVSSLKEGSVDVSVNGDSLQPVKNGQTMISNVNGVKTLSLASSGTLILARAIDSIATEAASELGIRASKLNLDKLETLLLAFDESFNKKADSLIKKTQVEFKPKVLNEYIGKPSVTLEALYVPGGLISVQGLVDTISESGLYKRTIEWEDSTAFGPKRFIVNCGNGEVEYICHTWNMNFVSAKMAEVLTKADERKANVVKDSAQQPKILKPTIVIEGSGRERIHVLPEERDIPATLRFSVAGLMGADLKQIKKIVVKRKGVVIKTFSGDELTTNSFKLPLRLKQNRVAHIEISVYFVNGKRIKVRKVYETYCYFENYEGGKKSNRINDMTAEEEYKNVVSKHLLKDE
ncbi:FecR family protein [Fibrobacter sp. UWB12]|nr:FecR family protein [Fibrobacter sp. UWB12]SIN92235.1 FecR family protein [Fibrobacter sp. UWB11]